MAVSLTSWAGARGVVRAAILCDLTSSRRIGGPAAFRHCSGSCPTRSSDGPRRQDPAVARACGADVRVQRPPRRSASRSVSWRPAAAHLRWRPGSSGRWGRRQFRRRAQRPPERRALLSVDTNTSPVLDHDGRPLHDQSLPRCHGAPQAFQEELDRFLRSRWTSSASPDSRGLSAPESRLGNAHRVADTGVEVTQLRRSRPRGGPEAPARPVPASGEERRRDAVRPHPVPGRSSRPVLWNVASLAQRVVYAVGAITDEKEAHWRCVRRTTTWRDAWRPGPFS